MIIGITGHRPAPHLGGYSRVNFVRDFVINEASKFLDSVRPSKLILGMAIGFDMWMAELAIKKNIPFIAAMPFKGQELYWPKESQNHYRNLLDHADQIEFVSAGGFASWKMQVRNQFIVDRSDVMLAAFNQNVNGGGTFNCIQYAKSKDKKIYIIDPSFYQQAEN